MISRNNYEIFFIDYIEGNLHPDVVSELLLFLEVNPDLAAELEGIENATLSQIPEIFDLKDGLKKTEPELSRDEIDFLLARKLEGDLSESEIKLSEKLIADYPFVATAEKAFALTRLKPESVIFTEKDQLYFPEHPDLNNIQMLLIAKVEGDLTLEQNEKLSALLASDASLQSELGWYYKTRLKPEAVVFEGKAKLKQKATTVISLRRILYATTAAAAALVLWFSVDNGKSVPASLATESTHNISIPEAVAQSNDSTENNKNVNGRDNKFPRHTHHSSNDVAHYESTPRNENQKMENPNQSDETLARPSFNKIQHITWDAFAVNAPRAELALKPEAVMPYIHEQKIIPAQNADHENYLTLTEFLTGKTKEKLWGNVEYPEENFVLALAERGLNKHAGNVVPDLEVERISTKEEKSFRLKFWKFEFERKR
ncbi:MAG: hypothetical protein SH856_13720 [Flavobacteriales bacterium]|mgnify:CR=1 FL=1|nr:hypothetical protein [Flavobacteriales bacterium]